MAGSPSYGAAFDAHWRAILRDGDPRQRLLALRLLHAGGRDLAAMRAAHREALRIASETPDDPLIARMQAWFCHGLPEGCTATERGAWAATEPANMAALISGLSALLDDPAAVDAALACAARGERYDSHHLALAREAVVLFDDVPLPPLAAEERRWLADVGLPPTDASRRLMMSTGMVAALPMAEIQGISRACRPPVSSRRARDCRTVLLQMAQGSTTIERLLSYSLLEQLSRGTPEGPHWALQNRRLRWWMHQMSRVHTGGDFWRDTLQFGEVDALRRLLVRTGSPLDPPLRWNAPGY